MSAAPKSAPGLRGVVSLSHQVTSGDIRQPVGGGRGGDCLTDNCCQHQGGTRPPEQSVLARPAAPGNTCPFPLVLKAMCVSLANPPLNTALTSASFCVVVWHPRSQAHGFFQGRLTWKESFLIKLCPRFNFFSSNDENFVIQGVFVFSAASRKLGV